ncbi:MAG: hypothetical protein ABSG69_18060 [Candidatus Acidiferrum sp.]|jgi:hypothetical protein
MKHVLKVVAIGLLAVLGAVAAEAQTNPIVGTWKLNTAKSKYSPGPTPKSMTRTVTADGDGLKYAFEGVAGDGSAIVYGFTTKFDGTARPITGSIPSGADNVSVTKTDDHHYTATLKKGDKLVGTSKVTISADGKVTTVDAISETATGAKSHDAQVWDKQ